MKYPCYQASATASSTTTTTPTYLPQSLERLPVFLPPPGHLMVSFRAPDGRRLIAGAVRTRAAGHDPRQPQQETYEQHGQDPVPHDTSPGGTISGFSSFSTTAVSFESSSTFHQLSWPTIWYS